jgi:transposase
MMGHHDRSEALFYYFRLEDHIPENHLLRLIDKHISFEFVRQQLKDSYSETGRPSIDPELLLRILLIGYLYGITSERRLVEELGMHLAWRWFTALGFDQEIPHHSTFSKNRHGRFQQSQLFEQLFEQIVRQCVEVGLVEGKHLSVDGSFVEANAAKESRIPREQLAEAAQVHHSVRQYLREVEEQNPVEEPVHEQDQVSTTDPDSTYATKGGTPARLGYYDNYLVDNDSWRASHSGTHESGNGGSTRHADSFHVMARARARIGGGRHDLWQRGVLAMARRSRHYSLHANSRQYPPQEESVLRSRAFYLSARTQSLYLSRWPGTQLWRSRVSEPCLQLHRNTQKVWPVLAPTPMYQCCFPGPDHPPERTSPATCAGVGQHARVRPSPAAKKEGGSLVRGTEKSDRAASLTLATYPIRAGAVLSSSGSPKHETLGAVPQPYADSGNRNCMNRVRKRKGN